MGAGSQRDPGGSATRMAGTKADFAEAVPVLKRLAAKVRQAKRLNGPAVRTTTVTSRLCGSQLSLDAELQEERITAIGFHVRACSLGQAATALVAQHAIGLTLAEVKEVKASLEAILGGTDPKQLDLRWPDLWIFSHAVSLSSRHGAALLPFQALEILMEEPA